MIAVATGGPPINSVNPDYAVQWSQVDLELQRRSLANPNPHRDLRDWHGRRADGTLPRYVERRAYIREMYEALEDTIRRGAERRHGDEVEPTGWDRVDRQVDRMRRHVRDARTEEEFQAVGLLGREVIISLAQAVYEAAEHSATGEKPSNTDAKRMLDEYISVEMPGSGSKELRELFGQFFKRRWRFSTIGMRTGGRLRSATS